MVLDAAGDTRLIGEDLGTVPDYVRPNLTALGIAGFKIPIWEPDPRTGGLLPGGDYARLSLATYGTHDHEPLLRLVEPLAAAPPTRAARTRQARAISPGFPHEDRHGAFSERVHGQLLEALFRSNSWIAVCMITDLLARDERFNVPGTSANSNWSQRMHVTLETLHGDPAHRGTHAQHSATMLGAVRTRHASALIRSLRHSRRERELLTVSAHIVRTDIESCATVTATHSRANGATATASPPVTNRITQLVAQLGEVIVGKEETIRLAVVCLLARGHLLIEDVPGVGKTTLSQALARSLGLPFRRIQFTSDLLPADIIGNSIFDREHSRFVFHPGPIFAPVVLIDEVNRATPKTQSALLEAMEEYQVSADGVTPRAAAAVFRHRHAESRGSRSAPSRCPRASSTVS